MSIKKLGSIKLTDNVLVSSVDLASSEVTGILGVANGGTGQSVFTNGQLLIGNTTGNTLTKATLTAGANITITNGPGTITIASTGGGGLTPTTVGANLYTLPDPNAIGFIRINADNTVSALNAAGFRDAIQAFRGDNAQLANTDLNTMLTSGYYWSNTLFSTNSNIPYSNYFEMLNLTQGEGRRAQLWFADTPSSAGGVWWRPRQGDVTGWHPWEKFLTSVNYGSYALPLGGGTVTGLTSFTAAESLNLYGIRGLFSAGSDGQGIHLFSNVVIGDPTGWGQGLAGTPSRGLSTWGGIRVAYGNNAASTFNGQVIVPNSTTAIQLASGYTIGMGDWGMRNTTPYGWIQFGPANTSWAHIYADRTFYFNQELYVNGNQVLHAANYNSYAPTLTGGGASGTWGISITGSAASATTASSADYASNSGGLLGHTWTSAGKNVRGQEFYADGWFRNYSSGYGLYNEANSNHFYSAGTYWNIGYAGTTGIILRNGYAGPIMGYLYGQTDNNFGLLHSGGGWAVRIYPGGGSGSLYGTWYADNLVIGSSQVLHAGNYNSYAPTLTGGGAYGTWGINVSGNSATASTAGYASTAGSATSATYIPSSGYQNGVYSWRQDSGTFAGYSGWASYLISNHGDGASYYNQTLIMPFWGPPQYSRLEGGTFRGPYVILSTENYSSYALPLSGGTITGNLTVNSNLNVLGQAYSYDWWRSYNATGWYNQTYGGGIWMSDSTWVRVYGTKDFYATASIAAVGNVTAYYSDERLKTKTGVIDSALAKVRKLTGFLYVENDTARKVGYKNANQQVGVSAQAVQAVLPEAVSLAPFDMHTNPDTGEITSKSGENYLTVDYSRLVPLLIEAIKELADAVEGSR